MRHYIVVAQGVYLQDAHGPYTKRQAKIAAQQLATADRDSYHSWNVREITPDGLSDEVIASYHKWDSNFEANVRRELADAAAEELRRQGKPIPIAMKRQA